MKASAPALLAAALAALALAAPAAAQDPPPEETVWLCKPGVEPNPCRESLETTIETEGEEPRVENPGFPRKPKIDCFYVYPTVSEDQGTNSDLSIDPEHIAIARFQAARFSQRCRVFAPMYRQRTLLSIAAGTPEQQAEGLKIAFADVRAAWLDYLENYSKGRGFVLIGHSQGTTMLRQLVRTEVDRKRKVRKRMVSGLLLGANVTVEENEVVDGDFKRVPGCTGPGQFGCVVAWSAFHETPPENARFGRPTAGAGTTAFGFPAGDGYEVLCSDPEALTEGKAPLTTYLRSEAYPGVIGALLVVMYGGPPPSAETPWLQPSERYSGKCAESEGANFLKVTPIGSARTLTSTPDSSWGLHLADVNIALGELVGIVRMQKRAYVKARR